VRFDLLLILFGNNRNAFVIRTAETSNMVEKISKAPIIAEYVANAPGELANGDKVFHRIMQSQQHDEFGTCALQGNQIRPYPIESSSTRREFARGIMIIGVAIKRYLEKIDLMIKTLQEAILIEEIAIGGHT